MDERQIWSLDHWKCHLHCHCHRLSLSELFMSILLTAFCAMFCQYLISEIKVKHQNGTCYRTRFYPRELWNIHSILAKVLEKEKYSHFMWGNVCFTSKVQRVCQRKALGIRVKINGELHRSWLKVFQVAPKHWRAGHGSQELSFDHRSQSTPSFSLHTHRVWASWMCKSPADTAALGSMWAPQLSLCEGRLCLK